MTIKFRFFGEEEEEEEVGKNKCSLFQFPFWGCFLSSNISHIYPLKKLFVLIFSVWKTNQSDENLF